MTPPRGMLVVLLVLAAACRNRGTSDPERAMKQLRSDDPAVRGEAARKLGAAHARWAAGAIAPLLKDARTRREAALALQEVGGPGEVQPLLETLPAADAGTGPDDAEIARALGNIGDARAVPALLRLARNGDGPTRLAAIDALGRLRAQAAVPLLLNDLGADAASGGRASLEVARAATTALGRIGDPAAIPVLIQALVKDRRGETLLPEASFALFLLGPPAVEPLVRIAENRDPAFLAWAGEQRVPPAAVYSRVAVVLGDLEDARATPALARLLDFKDAEPDPRDEEKLTALVRRFAASALGRLRAKDVAVRLQALVSTEPGQDDDLVAAAAEALVWIGDRAQARELMRKAKSGVLKLRLTVAQSAALFGEPALGNDILGIALRESKGRQESCVKALQDLTMPGIDPRRACDLLATQFGELSNPLEAARVCAQDAPCWLPRLADADPVVRARAAYELGRAGSGEAVPALVSACRDEQLLVREAAIRSLDWLASVPAAREALRAAAAPLADQLAAEKSRRELAVVNADLLRVQVRLSRL